MKLIILFFANFIASVAMGLSLTIVPWELSNSLGGEKVLAFTATYASAFLIFLSPVAGRVVDSVSRRSALVVCIVLMGAVLQLTSLTFDSAALRVLSLGAFYFASQIFFLFFYNALSAYIQEVFAEDERGKVNGWMQVEMQLSSLATGLLMIYAITSSGFALALQINGFLLFVSAILLCFLPYTKQERPARARASRAVFRDILRRGDLLLLGICANVSFVCVLMLNVVHPIYFNSVLGLDVSSLAAVSISFGVGAALSGLLVSRIASKQSALSIMQVALTAFTLSMLTICLFPIFPLIVGGAAVLGAASTAIRVAFNTYMMSMVDKGIFGSYLSVISTATYLQRTIFGFLLALIIAGYPASNYYWFVFAMSVTGLMLLQVYSWIATSQKLEATPAEN